MNGLYSVLIVATLVALSWSQPIKVKNVGDICPNGGHPVCVYINGEQYLFENECVLVVFKQLSNQDFGVVKADLNECHQSHENSIDDPFKHSAATIKQRFRRQLSAEAPKAFQTIISGVSDITSTGTNQVDHNRNTLNSVFNTLSGIFRNLANQAGLRIANLTT